MILPISVIIPTMDRPLSLDRTLNSIVIGNNVPKQVIVIDQSQNELSYKDTLSICNKYSKLVTTFIVKHLHTPSLTKARNYGYTFSTEDIVVLSDDDVDVNHDTFSNIANLMKDTSIAMIAGIDELTQVSKTNIGYLLGTKSFINRKIGHVTLSMVSRYPDSITSQTETQWAQGYFFVVRKSLIDKWNIKWDERLSSYAYAEDLDFSFTYYKYAKSENLKCVLDPKIKIKHLASLEYRIPSSLSTYMYVLNRAYLCHKHNMGIRGVIGCWWCDLWRLTQRIVYRQDSKVFFHALWCKIKYHRDIINGDLDYTKFLK